MGDGRVVGSVGKRPLREALRDFVPQGELLDDETFRRRHLLLSILLALHLPALVAFALVRGFDADVTFLAVLPLAPFLIVGRLVRERRIAAFFVTAGLVYCAVVLVYLSGGSIEAHFHFFVLIGFIALYQDWVPFAWNVVFVVLSHGLANEMAPEAMYNHHAAQTSPWTWALIHGVAVLAACLGVGIYWRDAEIVQRRSIAMAGDLATAEVTAAEAESARRRSESELLVHLARRNQSLLDRQLALISGLDRDGEVFKLDHLATRMRRNAESLLVLAGEEPPRRRGESVLLADIVRAAVTEVEDYGRIEMMVHNYVEVQSSTVEDLVHLLAELVENATMFSSPTTRVQVRTLLPPGDDSETIVVVEDNGIGMAAAELARANKVLAEPPELDGSWSTLGFQVVSRLARRHALRIWMEDTTDGGLTALVALPPALVGRRHLAVSAAGVVADGEVKVVDAQVPGQDVQWRAVDVGTAARLRLPPAVRPSAVAGAGRQEQVAMADLGEDSIGAVVRHDWNEDQGGEDDQRLPVLGGLGIPNTDQASLPFVPLELGPAQQQGQVVPERGQRKPRKPRQQRSAGDRVAASAMLSQFQASQRAGRIMTGQQLDRGEEDPSDAGDE
jgi:signal transduction histidine kinase